MHCNRNLRFGTAGALVLVLVLTAGSLSLHAQTKQFLTWQADLDYLQNLADGDLASQTAKIEQIRKGVELWIDMHPSTAVELAAAPQKPWGAPELRNQVTALAGAVDAILLEDPSQPFNLGSVAISVTSEASPLSPKTDSFTRTEIQNRNANSVAAALDYLPGLSQDISAQRNETRIFLRGFNNLGQVPLYLDGIPIQVPYDGTLDLKRFLTGDIAEIQVAKGYSSPLMGANNLGGSINLVSREPARKFESDFMIGTGSGEKFQTALQLGTKWDSFYFQGSAEWLQKEFVPLSGDFDVDHHPNQTNYELNHSNSRDAKYTGRIAYTPKGRDQYVFSYTNQKGEKGQPLYAGENVDARNRYWDWPFWNKYSYYFNSSTELDETTSLKLRLFYDQFKNGLSSFDNDGYDSMTKRSAFYSYYDDHTSGMSMEITTRALAHNTLSFSFFYKDDVHKSGGLNPWYETQVPPETADEVKTLSIGFQDIITLTEKLRATFGFSADHLIGVQTQQLNDDKDAIVPLQCQDDPDNASYTGCTPNQWTYNPQISVSYQLTDPGTLFVTFADRGRFPLMKEMYTSGLGQRMPSPDLEAERSRNWNVGYTHAFSSKTVGQIEYFHNTIRDAINDVFVPDPGWPDNPVCEESDAPGYCEKFANVTEEVHHGFEISVRSTPVQPLTLDASYSYINRTVDYDPEVLRLNPEYLILYPLPRNKVVFNATAQLPHAILALLTYRYAAGLQLQDTSYDSRNFDLGSVDPEYLALLRPYAESHHVVDIGTVAPIAAGVSVQAGIQNLFDTDYHYNPGYPEAGRNWYFNLRHKF